MGAYKKIIGGGVTAGLGARYVYNKFNEKSKPSEEDTLVAARNNKLHKLVKHHKEMQASKAAENAGVARETAAKARAAASAEQNAGVARETAAKARAAASAEQNAGVARETAAKARAVTSAEQNAGVARETAAKARAADLAEKSRKARSEYIPGMKKLGNTPDNPAGKPSSTTMDKLRNFGSHAKDTAKEAYSQFSHSPKSQMIAGGTAAALGAGLAAKRYLQRRKK